MLNLITSTAFNIPSCVWRGWGCFQNSTLCIKFVNGPKVLFSSPQRAQTVALASILSKDHPSLIIINRDVCVFLASRPYGAAKSVSSIASGSTLIIGGMREGLLLHVCGQLGLCNYTSRNGRRSLK